MTDIDQKDGPVKTCTTCNETKPLAQFYKHPFGLHGRDNKCAECAKEYEKLRRKDPVMGLAIREKDKDRRSTPDAKKKRRERNAKKRLKAAALASPAPVATSKECPLCLAAKPLSDYYKDSRSKIGISTYCKACTNEFNKRWREDNPDKFSEGSSLPILDALASKWQVSIIVQKEDFLRPDSGSWQVSKQREAYANIPRFGRLSNPKTWGYSTSTCGTDGAIRCAGMWAANKSTIPRMHNKFLVLCRCEIPPHPDDLGPNPYHPYAVITGSFNMTNNATDSLENIVIINDRKIANAYANEHAAIYGISEPLDWEKPYVAPEHRIGT